MGIYASIDIYAYTGKMPIGINDMPIIINAHIIIYAYIGIICPYGHKCLYAHECLYTLMPIIGIYAYMGIYYTSISFMHISILPIIYA